MVFRGLRVYHVVVKSALSKSGLPDIDYALNPYMGCGHGCLYCYARLYTRDKRAAENWGKVVVVKSNIVSALSRETRHLEPGVVGVGTITDAYQPVEAVYKLTRKCIEVLLERGFQVSVQTKNPLVLRDVDLFTQYREHVDVGFTITSLSNKIAGFMEPSAPPPKARVAALRKLRELGIRVWVFYGPIVPGLNDDTETIGDMTRLAADLGATLYYDPLHVKRFMHSPRHPLHEYVSRRNNAWWAETRAKILEYCREYGLTCKPGFEGDISEH